MREVLIKWLAIQVVIAGMKALGGGSASFGINEGAFAGMGWDMAGAHGGVFPHIKSFKRFSKGGMTSRPSLALLGDNPSGKELVIPSENIKKDSASGYVREGQNVNVLNIISDEDIYEIMSRTKGQRVIVNTIGADMRKGSSFRSYRT
jgi:hypothetical protein